MKDTSARTVRALGRSALGTAAVLVVLGASAEASAEPVRVGRLSLNGGGAGDPVWPNLPALRSSYETAFGGPSQVAITVDRPASAGLPTAAELALVDVLWADPFVATSRPQADVDRLVAWVRGGGHLVLGMEAFGAVGLNQQMFTGFNVPGVTVSSTNSGASPFPAPTMSALGLGTGFSPSNSSSYDVYMGVPSCHAVYPNTVHFFGAEHVRGGSFYASGEVQHPFFLAVSGTETMSRLAARHRVYMYGSDEQLWALDETGIVRPNAPCAGRTTISGCNTMPSVCSPTEVCYAPGDVCVTPVCGDGLLTNEACDDGNTAPGDGCSSLCMVEPGYTCVDAPASTPDSVCQDVDECGLGTDDCDPNATCANVPGSFTCTCDAGYVGDGVTCVDVDECALGTDDCDPNAVCTNAPGSFTCVRGPGFTGDGVTCTDIDECALDTDNCSFNGTCTNVPGAFTCACNPGFEGNGVSCSDPDADDDGVCNGAGASAGICVAGPDNCLDTPNTNQADADGDGTGDACEMDTDGDGVVDDTDNCVDVVNPGQANNDGDAQGDVCDPDDDNDGIADVIEDSNGDGQLDPGETDPRNPDTDGDGLPDGLEDRDQDGELDPGETDPLDVDSDDDGLADGEEDANQDGLVGDDETDPADADTDGDGLSDGLELGLTEGVADPDGAGPLLGSTGFTPDADPDTTTDPLDADSDDGSVSDGDEDSNHNGRVDEDERDPNDGSDDVTPEDLDGDGIANVDEDKNGNGVVDDGETDPFDRDSDDDGVNDGTEDANHDGVVDDGETDPTNPDSDGDGLTDGLELGLTEGAADPDGDGPIKGSEAFVGDADPSTTTDPLDADTDDGSVSDGDEDANHNGRVDEDETDPNDGSDDLEQPASGSGGSGGAGGQGGSGGSELGYSPEGAGAFRCEAAPASSHSGAGGLLLGLLGMLSLRRRRAR